jgi:hypothetical protein
MVVVVVVWGVHGGHRVWGFRPAQQRDHLDVSRLAEAHTVKHGVVHAHPKAVEGGGLVRVVDQPFQLPVLKRKPAQGLHFALGPQGSEGAVPDFEEVGGLAVAHLAVQLGADFVGPRLLSLKKKKNDDAAGCCSSRRDRQTMGWFEKRQDKKGNEKIRQGGSGVDGALRALV